MNHKLHVIPASIFCIVSILLFNEVSLFTLNPFELLGSKMEYSDMYYSNISHKTNTDTSLVLVNIQNFGRKEIGLGISKICVEEPELLVLDVIFQQLKDSKQDSILKIALNSSDRVVLSQLNEDSLSGTHPYFGMFESGINQLIKDHQGIVRYAELKGTCNKDVLLAEKMYSSVFGKASTEKGRKEINFISSKNNFITVELDDILTGRFNPGIFKSKVILIGYAGQNWESDRNYDDDHFVTPLSYAPNTFEYRRTPGILIHANLYQNLRDNSFIRHIPAWVAWLLTFVVLLFVNSFYLQHYASFSLSFYFKCRLFQFIAVSILAFLIFALFHWFRLKLNTTSLLMSVIGSFELTVLYMTIVKSFKRRYLYV